MNVDKLRQDFPALQKNNIIYFDNACMTFKPIQVIEKMNEYYKEYPACGARSLHRLGKKVDEEVAAARSNVQKLINAKSTEEIIFTRNTTEGINLVANSLALKSGDVVLGTDKEHNSNLIPWLRLAKLKGTQHKVVVSNPDNTFNLDNFSKLLTKDVKLVSVVHTSNLDGVTVPLKEIIKLAHDNGSLVLVDGAQSVPHKTVDVRKLDMDFLSFSGHKMLGPTGTGVLYGKKDLLESMEQFMVGGETVIDSTYDDYKVEKLPNKFEAGLQDYAGIIGLGEAAKYLIGVGFEDIEAYESKLNSRITDAMRYLEPVNIIGPLEPSLRSGIVGFTVKGMDPHNVAGIMDHSANIMLRSGAHCVHSWFNAHNVKGSVRASLYFYNTERECDVFLETLKKVIVLSK